MSAVGNMSFVFDTEFQRDSRERMKRAIQQEPALFAACMRPNESDSPKFVHDYDCCVDWLSLCRKRKTVNPAAGTSYALKHRVEQYFSQCGAPMHISHAAFMAAVITSGIRYRTTTGDNPHLELAISMFLPDPNKDKPQVTAAWWRYLTEFSQAN